jgi:hypothetical protein
MRFLIVGSAEEYRTVVPAAPGCRLVGETDSWPPAPADRDGCDAVIVALPLARRAEAIRWAIERGLPVLAEAPLAEGPDEARALCELADAKRVRLAVTMPHRFEPPVARTLELVRSGAIGPLAGLRAEVGSSHAHFATLDLTRLLLGEIVSCQAHESFALLRNADRAAAELRSVEGGQGPVIDLLGQGGYLRLALGPWVVSGKLANGRRVRCLHRGALLAECWTRLRHGCSGILRRELAAFASLGPAPSLLATGWDACRLGEMLAALEQSRWLEAEVSLRPLPVVLPSARKTSLVRGREE